MSKFKKGDSVLKIVDRFTTMKGNIRSKAFFVQGIPFYQVLYKGLYGLGIYTFDRESELTLYQEKPNRIILK